MYLEYNKNGAISSSICKIAFAHGVISFAFNSYTFVYNNN